MNIECGHCGGNYAIELWLAEPVFGDHGVNVIQCPRCHIASRRIVKGGKPVMKIVTGDLFNLGNVSMAAADLHQLPRFPYHFTHRISSEHSALRVNKGNL